MDNNTAIIRYQNWIEIFREWAASGMTKRDFCREKNIREKRSTTISIRSGAWQLNQQDFLQQPAETIRRS